MADNVTITAGAGTTIAADEVVDGTLGTVKVPYGKIVDGTIDGTNKLAITSTNAAQVAGDKAHDAVDGGNPAKIGGKANSSAPTNVAAGDRVDAYFDLAGRLKVDASDVAVPITDNSGSLTVDGSVTATQGTATNLKTQAEAYQGGSAVASGNPLEVNLRSSTVGVATAANQSTANTALAAIQTATELIDDTVFTDDTSTHSTGTTKGLGIMAAATPTDGSVNANDIGMVAMTTDRKMHVSVQDALPAGTNAIGKLAANSGVDIGDVDVTSVSGNVTVVQSTASSLKTEPAGQVAHDAADSGNPLKVGFKAETSPKGITVVADGDRTDGYADADGLQLVKLNTTGADLLSERISNTNGTSTAFTNFSAVASTYNYVTAISCFNSSSTTGYVDFRDGTAGTILWTMALPAGSGSTIANAAPMFKTSANTALAFDVSAALTTVYISVSGFQSKV